jgi:hypothetical protein
MSDTPKTDWSETLETIAHRAEHRANQLESELATALADTRRLEFVLPMLCGDISSEIDRRMLRLEAALLLGLDHRAAVDAAMREEKP